jgi:hypothetical protein
MPHLAVDKSTCHVFVLEFVCLLEPFGFCMSWIRQNTFLTMDRYDVDSCPWTTLSKIDWFMRESENMDSPKLTIQ